MDVAKFTEEYGLTFLKSAESVNDCEWMDRRPTDIGLVDVYKDAFDEIPMLAIHPNSSIKKRALRRMFGKYAGVPEDSCIFYDANENMLFINSEDGIRSFISSLEKLKDRPPIIKKEKHPYPLVSVYR